MIASYPTCHQGVLASIVLTDLNNKIKVVRKQERISLK
jgi:hypothetical protein